METQALRIRVAFDDCSVLNLAQRSDGMNNSWMLIEPNQHPKISDVCSRVIHQFNLLSSCPNGVVLYMEGFVLPPSESIRILKDNDIICVKRKGVALAEAVEGADACKLLNDDVRKKEPVDNGMLLLANEEFDKETGGYRSEYEVEKSEDEPSPKETSSKKRKASTKLRRSKKKKHRLAETDGVEDKVPAEDNGVNDDGGLSKKIINKKIKPNKKKSKPNDEIKKENAETSDKNIEDDVEGVEHVSSARDGTKKGPSRSARRKKAKRQWRREAAKRELNPDTHVEPEISKTENKEATGGPLKQDQVPVEVKHEEIIEQGINDNDNGVTKLVPSVVRPGHIRFEPLDEDEDAKQIEVPDVPFQWNGITSKKKGQKWGLETSSSSKMDYSQKATEEPSAMVMEDAQVPLVDSISFEQLPLCSSPKADDVIAYRVVELSSSWTPELSSFRVGKISFYDGDNIVLMPVPEYPIVLDKMEMDEDGPDNNSLYKEDGSLEINFAALADVRSLKQSNSDAVKAVSNGVNQTAQGDKKNAASNLTSKSNERKENISKDPSPAQALAGNKEGNTWAEIQELLSAKKSELLESTEEMKKDSGWNKWSYRALRGSALGPTISLLRSENDS
ncbi:putative coilin [Helianthus annuus]|nr:putative coilin [Helianthus annuus]